jgi:hypothetical protein
VPSYYVARIEATSDFDKEGEPRGLENATSVVATF